MTSELMQFGWLKKGDRSSKRKGDRLSELLKRAIDLFLPQMDAD